MASTAAAQIMRQANTVKETMTGSEKAVSELWVSRQKLEDLYKRMLLLDLEYALDKKVEQDLWNHAFKNQISTLQAQAKDRQNPKKSEAQANLNLFLETASGFYLQFLQMICSTFKLDVPFRRKSVAFGMIKENTAYYKNIVTPKKSSCLYICCHCLVHLGDIARYRQQTEQAQTYYRHAANLSPNNGQPYNQLAILEASRGDKLSTVFYYVRSLAVRHPFPVAATNLEKFYSKLIKDTRSDFDGPNLTISEIVTAFLQFQALLHMATGLERASNLKSRITSSLGGHIRAETVTAAHLTGMVAISVFSLHRARQDTTGGSGDGTITSVAPRGRMKASATPEEERVISIHLAFTAKLLETMLAHTPKEDNKARDFLTLSAIKVLLDWLHLNNDVLSSKDFHNTSIWSDLCKLLNTQQWLLNDSNKAADKQRYEDTPLPEDIDLRCFQPLEPTYSSYNYHKGVGEELSAATERDLRCQRLVAHGKWLANDLPALRLMSYQPSKSIRNQFSTQKTSQGQDKHAPPVTKPSQRKNIAMQTILKKQQQKQTDLDKINSPLTVISEDGSVASSESAGSQGHGQAHKGRQAGMLTIPHKGGNHKNLPPRLAGKSGAGHTGQLNQSVSPRLQRKLGTQPQRAMYSKDMNEGNKKDKKKDKAGPDNDENSNNQDTEAYPSLDPDNYPALVSSRAPQMAIAGIIPQALHPGNISTAVNSSGWTGGYAYSSKNTPGGGTTSHNVGEGLNPPPPSLDLRYAGHAGGHPGSLISQPPPNLPTHGEGQHLAANSPRSPMALEAQQAEFMFNMQTRQQPSHQQQFQLFQQQKKQLSHPLHEFHNQPPPPQQSNILQYNTQQQATPSYHHQHQQQHQQQQQQVTLPTAAQLARMFPSQQQGASAASYSQGQGIGQGHTRAGGPDLASSNTADPAFYAKGRTPVGYIPPSNSGFVQQQSNKSSGGFSASSLMSATASTGAAFLGGHQAPPPKHPLHHHLVPQQQPHHHQQQQQQQQPSLPSGLLYQNIPLPGAADSHGANTDHKMMNQSQDARLSSSFHGHAAGTPKPDKQTGVHAQFYQQSGGGGNLRSQQQASILRSVMGDPPFLQAGGEYSLFSGSSPSWTSSLGKPGHGGAPQHGAVPLPSQIRPGGADMSQHSQNMWSASGPSPLERLLEQQKNWKHTDG